MANINQEIFIAVSFDIHPRFTYSLGTYFTEAEAIERIKQHCSPYEMKQTDSPGQVSYHCAPLECMVWVKKLIIGDAPDKKVILTNTTPQDFKGDGSTIEGVRLKVAQCEVFPQILSPLRGAELSQYRKTGHWVWYVFPTSNVGKNDPHSTALNNREDLMAIMRMDSHRKIWVEILQLLATAIRSQQSRVVLPSCDHGRVNFFLQEWEEPKYRMVRQRWLDFDQAVRGFAKAWSECNN
tara:strand:+ start:6649 stop:7362 length:714 start_codon:yes stop_codon:yes gene_type:complete